MRRKRDVLTALYLTVFWLGIVGIALAAELQTHKNSIVMKFVLIASGSFRMGTEPNVEEGGNDETPQHSVSISRRFLPLRQPGQ